MACEPCGDGFRTVQVIEPDGTLVTASSSGSTDQSLDESGSVALEAGQTTVEVRFQTTKASENYRFEYLYVDALDMADATDVEAVPVIQTVFGFTVKLVGTGVVIGGVPVGYVLRWRVVVNEFGPAILDQPETIYLQLPQVNLLLVHLTNPRSSTDYGFDELRVENLVDDVAEQTPVLVQVVLKTQTTFTIGLSPTPPTDNYFLAIKIPS